MSAPGEGAEPPAPEGTAQPLVSELPVGFSELEMNMQSLDIDVNFRCKIRLRQTPLASCAYFWRLRRQPIVDSACAGRPGVPCKPLCTGLCMLMRLMMMECRF